MSFVSNLNNVLGANLIGPGQSTMFSSSSIDETLAGNTSLTDGSVRILSGPSAYDQSNTTPVSVLSYTDNDHKAAPVSALIGNSDNSLFDIDLLSGSYGQSSAIDFNLGPDFFDPAPFHLANVNLVKDGVTSVDVFGHRAIDLSSITQATGIDPLANDVLYALNGPVDTVHDTVDGLTGDMLDGIGGGLDVSSILDGVLGGEGSLLGGITGGDGPLGVLDGVLGDDGILGGITGGDGPLGLLDGVLGDDGLLGGITGGDGGLLEGVLGDDGLGDLVDGLLGGVTGSANGGIDIGGLVEGLTGGITGGLDLGGGSADGEVSGGINLGGLLGGTGLVGGLLGGVLSH
jgi:hypothetical protein